jgi:hypothetical protein
MKSGTATKLLLDAALAAALLDVRPAGPSASGLRGRVCAALHAFRPAVARFYSDVRSPLAAVVAAAGSALRAGGHVVYAGAGRAAVVAVTDASECVPTFGARPDDVVAVARGGWAELTDAVLPPGRDIAQLPALAAADLVVLLGCAPDSASARDDAEWLRSCAAAAAAAGATVAALVVCGAGCAEVYADLGAGGLRAVAECVPWELAPGIPTFADVCLKLGGAWEHERCSRERLTSRMDSQRDHHGRLRACGQGVWQPHDRRAHRQRQAVHPCCRHRGHSGARQCRGGRVGAAVLDLPR